MDMTDRIARLEQAAITAFNEGFRTKSAQKNAAADATRAFELIRRSIGDTLIELRHASGSESIHPLYWDLPDSPRQFREKHAVALGAMGFSEEANRLQGLKDLRDAIMGAPITPPVKNDAVKVVTQRVHDTLKAQMARNLDNYRRAIELHDIFGGMPVSVRPHYVTNEHGTTFTRVFFYLAGKLTPLNVILAAMGAIDARESETGGA